MSLLRRTLLPLVVLMTAACGNEDPGAAPPVGKLVQSAKPRDTSPAVSAEDRAKLAADNGAFAQRLHQEIAKGAAGKNAASSPYSVSIALAMTSAGARGATLEELAKALQFSLPQEKLHPAFNAVDLELGKRGEAAAGKDGKPFRLRISNSLWGQEGTNFGAPFLDTLAVHYGAGMRVVDFRQDAEGARTQINAWISQETEKRIPELFGKGGINPLTRLVLVNAVYFNGAWKHPFKKESTAPAPFRLGSGETANVTTMKVDAPLQYAATDAYEAVSLPYQDDRLQFVIVAPKTGTVAELEASLDVGGIQSKLASDQIELHLPKFKISGDPISLKTTLQTLGMKLPFTDAADFTGISTDEPLHIQDVVHQAFVEVDEAGTEAAAATGVTVGTTSAPPPPRVVKIDRPFVFLLRDVPTNTTLFVGRVTDPR